VKDKIESTILADGDIGNGAAGPFESYGLAKNMVIKSAASHGRSLFVARDLEAGSLVQLRRHSAFQTEVA
jgi:hypothetical protein